MEFRIIIKCSLNISYCQVKLWESLQKNLDFFFFLISSILVKQKCPRICESFKIKKWRKKKKFKTKIFIRVFLYGQIQGSVKSRRLSIHTNNEWVLLTRLTRIYTRLGKEGFKSNWHNLIILNNFLTKFRR